MAIAFVNSTALQISVGNQSTWSIPTHSSRAGGAAFIVGLGMASTSVSASTVTDNAGNTYLKAIQTVSSKAQCAELWYATNISSASTRISVTNSGNSSGSLAVAQFTGISTANALLESTWFGSTALSTVFVCPEFTPSSANAVVIMFARSNVSTMSPVAFDGGQTAWTSTGNAVRQVGGYVIQGAASTFTGQWRSGAGTSTGRCQVGMVTAAFSDTQFVLPVSGWPGFALMGVQ